MTVSEATTQILESSAPGQWEDIATQLGKLNPSAVPDPTLKQTMQQSKGMGVTDGNTINHLLAVSLKDLYTNHIKTVFSACTNRGGMMKEITTRIWLQGSTSGSVFELCSYAEKLDTSNLQTGQWKAIWKITEQGELSGTIRIHSYTYEDGNTQFQWNKSFEPTVVASLTSTNEDSTAKKFLTQIITWETEVISMLQGIHEIIPDQLKKIRRVLPITKTKMNWEVEAQRSIQQLKKSTTTM